MKSKRIRDILYYTALAFYIFEYIFWSFNQVTSILSILAVIFTALIFILNLKNYNRKELAVSIAAIVVSLLIFVTSKDASLIKLFLFIISSKDTNFRKTAKFDFFIRLACSALVFILFSINMVDDVQVWVGGTLKHSLGFSHPNTLGAIAFFLIADYFYAFNKKINVINSIIILLICLFLLNVPHARTAVYTIAALYALILIFTSKNLNKIRKNKIIQFIIRNSYLIVSLLVFITTIFYITGLNIGEHLNTLLSNRLYYINNYYNEYGISLLGNDFTNFWIRLNTLDNAYAYIIFRYGLLFFILSIIVMRRYMSHLLKKKHFILICIFLVLFIYGISENSWLKIGDNIFIATIAGLFFPKVLHGENKKS